MTTEQKSKPDRNIFVKLIILPAILLLGSCNKELKKVATFGGTSAQLETATSNLAGDIYLSCVRSSNYIRLVNAEAIQLKLKSLQDCETQNKMASDNAIAANKVMIAYVEGLGNVAGNKAIPFDQSFSDIGTALKGIKISTGSGSPPFALKPDSVDAGIAISNLLNNLFTSQIRRSAVKKAIICTNDSLQIYGQGLISIYREAYLYGLLALEATRINDYYPSYAAILIERDAPPLDRIQLESEYNNSLELLSKREDSAKTYISFIENTLTTHAKLRDMFVKDKFSKKISSYCKNYLNTNNSSKALESTDSRFEVNDDMSRREETMAVKILAKYQLAIAPQVKQIIKNDR